MNEEWRPIPGTDGRYDASNLGRIRSWAPWRGQPAPRVMAPGSKGSKGHLMVNLRVDGKRIPMLVHRAVLAAFVGPAPIDKPITRHLDGDPTNNRLSNIAYGTYVENEADKLQHGRNYNATKPACKHGHPFDEENTLWFGDRRRCRTCEKQRGTYVASPCEVCGKSRTNMPRHLRLMHEAA